MNNVDFLFTYWKEMDQAYEDFIKLSSLSCPKGCSSCCENHHVHASSFEMLPAAKRLYQEGRIEEILEAIDQLPQNHCVLLKDHRCGLYQERPSMCRLFGLGRIENKDSFSICKIIKEHNPDKIKNLSSIHELKKLKSFNQLHLPLLTQIPQGEADELPINMALKKAIEKVLLYSHFQENL